ncbi:hypothetical protein POVCU1_059640 [Plasmodium ovale curtisi]|uniref:Uncharacterized protein n=1 Tax=Plasmodium ovale curtisi TaxID=864141 RepID=A0A1A8X700_PLAOA|nr:hypothetical protein POVCU1_059640 [Plasmodium ovale curtisi]
METEQLMLYATVIKYLEFVKDLSGQCNFTKYRYKHVNYLFRDSIVDYLNLNDDIICSDSFVSKYSNVRRYIQDVEYFL